MRGSAGKATPMQVDTSNSIAGRIEQAFATASRTTGTSFDYLVRTASRESNMNTQAQAPTSSAAGLFQFIESTWLEMVKERGDDIGLQTYADRISVSRGGKYTVSDPAVRKEILELRHDPQIASYMAAAYTQKNASTLSSALGRTPSSGELYIAHFLGPNGAERLIGLAESSPNASAAARFPRQAAANRSIFYNANGTPKSARAVYSELVSQHQGIEAAETMTASVDRERITDAFSVLGYAPSSDATKRVQAGWSATEASSPFEALFRTDTATAMGTGTFNAASWTSYRTASLDMRSPVPTSRSEGVRSLFAAPVPVPAQRRDAGPPSDGKPLDLRAYLAYQVTSKPKDLLPPA